MIEIIAETLGLGSSILEHPGLLLTSTRVVGDLFLLIKVTEKNLSRTGWQPCNTCHNWRGSQRVCGMQQIGEGTGSSVANRARNKTVQWIRQGIESRAAHWAEGRDQSGSWGWHKADF